MICFTGDSIPHCSYAPLFFYQNLTNYEETSRTERKKKAQRYGQDENSRRATALAQKIGYLRIEDFPRVKRLSRAPEARLQAEQCHTLRGAVMPCERRLGSNQALAS